MQYNEKGVYERTVYVNAFQIGADLGKKKQLKSEKKNGEHTTADIH